MTFLLTKTPILANTDTTSDLFNNLPIGIVILEKEIIYLTNGYKIFFANIQGRRLLQVPKDNNYSKFIAKIEHYKEFNMITQSETDSSLINHIFSSGFFEMGKTFISPNKTLLFVKVKHYNSKILISVDNYTDERQGLQNKFVQSIGYQYLLTLYHEINNPLNSLSATAGELLNIKEVNEESNIKNEKKKKRIELLIFLIQFFLKNFILFFQIKTTSKEDIKKNNSVISLENVFNSIKSKFIKLFTYKQIKYSENVTLLKRKTIKVNYFYFKNLIKMIYIYFYHKNLQGGCFTVSTEKTTSDKNIKLIFTSGKPNEFLAKSYSSFSENEKNKDTNKPKSKIKTIEMTEQIIQKISSLLNIKTELHFESQPISIILTLPVFDDEEFGTEAELEELSPNHNLKFKSLNRDLGKISLYNVRQSSLINEENFSTGGGEDEIPSKIIKTRTRISSKLNNTTKHSNLISSLFKTIAKTTNNEIMINDDIMNYMTSRRASFPNIKQSFFFNEMLNEDGSLNNKYHKPKTKSVIPAFSSMEEEEEEKDNDKKIYIDKTGIMLEDKQSSDSSSSNKSQKNISFCANHKNDSFTVGECENENDAPLFTCISINQIDNKKEDMIDFASRLHHPKKKKRTDLYFERKYKHLNDIKSQFNTPSKHDSVKTVISRNASNLSLSSCSCRDILIVDDEQFNVSCLSNILQKLKIKCDVCYNGKECIEKIEEKIAKNCNCSKASYRLILMDVLMPFMNGLEATEKIQSYVNEGKICSKNLNVVFISACVDQESNFDQLKQRDPIAKEFLLKPVKKSKIEEILKKYYYYEG